MLRLTATSPLGTFDGGGGGLRHLENLCVPLKNPGYTPAYSRIYSLLAATCIDFSLSIDYSRYFGDEIQYYYRQFSSVSA